MILSDAIDFSRLLGSPMKKTSFGEQNRLAALQTKGLGSGKMFLNSSSANFFVR
jgi:hypothetical protein